MASASQSEQKQNKLWQERLQDSNEAFEEWKERFKVQKAENFFEGQQKPEGVNEQEWITINKVYTHLLTQLPALYSVDPYYFVSVKRTFDLIDDSGRLDESQLADRIRDYEVKADIRQAHLNYLKVELKLKDTARMAIQDAHFGFGVVKIYFSAQMVDNPKAGEPVLDEEGEPLTDDAGAPLLEPDQLPIKERYNLERIDFDNIRFDCDAGPLPQSWGWIGERKKIKYGEALDDKRLDKKALKSILQKRKTDQPEEDQIIEFWEIYDLKKKEILSIAEEADTFLIKPRSVPRGTEDHAYAILRFTLRRKSPYPIPPLSQGLDAQHEYNSARSSILKHRKRFNRKYEVNMNKLTDETEADKLASGDDGTLIKTMAEGAVSPINDAPLDQMRYLEIQSLNQDMTELFGSSDNARSIASADSATEAGIISQYERIREGDRIGLVTDFLMDIGRKLDQLVQAHITRPEAIKVRGPQGEQWRLVKTDDYQDIQGEYEYQVDVGSTMPRLPQIERAQLIAFISQVVIPMPALLTQPAFMKKMAKMFGIDDEVMLQELQALGQQMVSGQMPMPGKTGSQPGVPENNPVAVQGGMAGGALGGIANGGGAPGVEAAVA